MSSSAQAAATYGDGSTTTETEKLRKVNGRWVVTM